MALVITIQARADMLDSDHAGTFCIRGALGRLDVNLAKKRQIRSLPRSKTIFAIIHHQMTQPSSPGEWCPMPLLLVRRTHDDVLGPGAVSGQLAHRAAEFEHGAVFVEDALCRFEIGR